MVECNFRYGLGVSTLSAGRSPAAPGGSTWLSGSRVVGVFVAGSLVFSSTAAVAATPSAPPQADPWAVLSVMSGGASAAAVCGAAAAARCGTGARAGMRAAGGGCARRVAARLRRPRRSRFRRSSRPGRAWESARCCSGCSRWPRASRSISCFAVTTTTMRTAPPDGLASRSRSDRKGRGVMKSWYLARARLV